MIKSTIIFLLTLFFLPLVAQQFPINGVKSIIDINNKPNIHFTSVATNDHITLKWSDKNEKQIIGFKILRSETKSGNYVLISSYESNPKLNPQSDKENKRQFSFVDLAVVPGTIYWYKLYCVDESKNATKYGPISASLPVHQSDSKVITVSPKRFRFEPIQKNNVRSTTTLQLDIPFGTESKHPTSISIYGPQGDRVKTIYKGSIEAGSYQLIWNGDTEEGNFVKDGVFFAVFENDIVKEATKLVLIK